MIMPRVIKKRSEKSGQPPGTLVHIGEQKLEKTRIAFIDYDETHFEEKEVNAVEECFPFIYKPTVTWINIDGLHQVPIIKTTGKRFIIHPLVLEDILDTGQRPKVEYFEEYIFVVLKMIFYDEKEHEAKAEQISFLIGSNFVVSFQEKGSDVFNPIRERIRSSKGIIRKVGADYLAYTLLDAVVDNYLMIIERLGEEIEDMEDELLSEPTSKTLQEIYRLQRDLIFLRKSVLPLRNVIKSMDRGGSPLIKESTEIYLRDVLDHTIQVIDNIETYQNIVSSMLDTYLSSMSNRTNEVMKVLTIIATIFIPLTFIVGIFGMNFNPDASPWNMPELNWGFGYISVLGVMIIIALGMIIYFKRKKWL
jgi:magnesium transporter